MAKRHATGGDSLGYTAYLEICRALDLKPVDLDHYKFLAQVCAIGPEMIPFQKGQETHVYNMNSRVHHPINSDDIKPLDAAQLKNLAALTKRLQK